MWKMEKENNKHDKNVYNGIIEIKKNEMKISEDNQMQSYLYALWRYDKHWHDSRMDDTIL